MYFPSKKDWWLTLLLWGVASVGVVVPLITGDVTAALFMLPLALVLLWFWFKTDYKIENEQIKVRYGPIRQTIHIKDIKRINKNKNPFMAPALSTDKIEILCSKYDVISISPVDQQKFIKDLLEINPTILLDNRLNVSN
ncbi:PH domain-containing protein [Virgibacillus sp. C22-A2]|uniref:PH domain-containing protein n=1 Tax=Virgibacillus tibetensis TaxID=3042313 RepID=A0ABU6KBJ6_9BACI|nr:PH domain-containing protein [Virgibacillus sp. C22-A2]